MEPESKSTSQQTENMIKTIIIDDEPFVRKGLKSMLLDHSNIEVIGECESVAEALIVTNATKPDLILLDINLPDGTGFDFLDKIELEGLNVIFITAYHEYALQALKAGAIDYLLKPISSDELEEAISKIDLTQDNLIKERLAISKTSLVSKSDKIVLRFQDKYQIVRFSDLLYCKSDSGYTNFYLADGRHFITSKNIKEYEKSLPDNFVRCHQSYVVNLDYADNYNKEGVIVLTTGENIAVSVRKKELLLEKLTKI